MKKSLMGGSAAAMLLASIGMTLLAVAVAVGVVGTSTGVLVYRVAVAVVACGLAGLAFQKALDLRRSEAEARKKTLAPVPIRARARK